MCMATFMRDSGVESSKNVVASTVANRVEMGVVILTLIFNGFGRRLSLS